MNKLTMIEFLSFMQSGLIEREIPKILMIFSTIINKILKKVILRLIERHKLSFSKDALKI